MNLNVTFPINTELKKYLFKLKPLRSDGLFLSIPCAESNNKVRFLHTSFHEGGHIVALADNNGNVYLIDYSTCKFWRLPKLESCSFIKFSAFRQEELLTGKNNGTILISNFESGYVVGKLRGHKFPVRYVSFARNSNCLSASQFDAILWDLQTNTKKQVLNLEKNIVLKYVAFIPVSYNILACFQDDLIQIWNNKFKSIKQFLPMNWNNFAVKSIAFSRNGEVMVVCGYLPTLAIFLLNNWKLWKLVSLPEYIHTVKHIEFISQPFDGGCNKILAILSGQGTAYFYDVDNNIIISELTLKSEIKKFICCPNGNYIACIQCSGEVELYDLGKYIMAPIDTRVERHPRKMKIGYENSEKIGAVKYQINSVLDTGRLRPILKQYGEYPDSHRTKIWEKLLELPNNIHHYNSIINHVTLITFQDLLVQYPLECKSSLQCLKKLLNNLVTWCPFFAKVNYLPMLAFPFVKVLHNKPVTCFEALCTILLNWCQHWFEYFPLPPVNILAIIDNLLLEHDPELLYHFSSNKISSNLYAWPILETVFSEVLTSKEWLQLWDHILTNEISFLLCAVAAYIITQRSTLIYLKDARDFEFFFHNQNPNDMKKFIKTTYCILDHTNENMHPRQYLETFHGIDKGNYPLFLAYPKSVIDVQAEQIQQKQGVKSKADEFNYLMKPKGI